MIQKMVRREGGRLDVEQSIAGLIGDLKALADLYGEDNVSFSLEEGTYDSVRDVYIYFEALETEREALIREEKEANYQKLRDERDAVTYALLKKKFE